VPRIPTFDDYRAFDGAHCAAIWERLSDSWRCPCCDRTKFEVMRWTKRKPPGHTVSFMGWLAAFHTHHDHGSDPYGFDFDGTLYSQGLARFAPVVICDHCNAADGAAKRKLVLPRAWSFSPMEIGEFVIATPHASHVIDYVKAGEIYEIFAPTLTDGNGADLCRAKLGAAGTGSALA
jgi:hypothetical protein